VLQKLSCANEFGVAEAFCLLQVSGAAFLLLNQHPPAHHPLDDILTQLWMSLN
jgi:hypothetical protein